jgi:hypothetical protein
MKIIKRIIGVFILLNLVPVLFVLTPPYTDSWYIRYLAGYVIDVSAVGLFALIVLAAYLIG